MPVRQEGLLSAKTYVLLLRPGALDLVVFLPTRVQTPVHEPRGIWVVVFDYALERQLGTA